MALTLEQIRELLKSPNRKTAISKAIKHENRLRFHTEAALENGENGPTITNFLEWVRSLIPADKYRTFLNLFQLPNMNLDLTGSIYNELERVFDGKNPVYEYQFNDTFYADDWDWYRSEKLDDPNVWRVKGWDRVKTSINSILIVDLPQTQSAAAPEPYFYFLDIRQVIDYGYDAEADKIEYIIFRQPDSKIAAFDDETFRVFDVDDKGLIIGEPLETPHALGFCPARFFWTDKLTQADPAIKKSPLSAHLSDLDWLLFFSVSKRHLDLYAPYPIYSSYAADCDFEDLESGNYCDEGFLRNGSNNYIVQRDGSVEKCPICANKNLVGVGSFIEVPTPTKDDPDLRNPVHITSIDKGSLDYNVEEVARIKAKIHTGAIGQGGAIEDKQSINEMQVTANFESRTSVLNTIKGNLEAAQKFVNDTICVLRYGDNFLGSSLSMGTEFYIYTVADLYAQFKTAKENGATMAELDAIADQVAATEYRNNPVQMQRMSTLRHLEPYRHFTLDEVLKMDAAALIDKDLLLIKINFNTFVDRFERENINIVEFGALIEFSTKIETITKKFLDYVRDQKTRPSGDKADPNKPDNKARGSGAED